MTCFPTPYACPARQEPGTMRKIESLGDLFIILILKEDRQGAIYDQPIETVYGIGYRLIEVEHS